jgi:hypothetical protein
MVVPMVVSMRVPVVESHNSNKVDKKTGYTDSQELSKAMHLAA